MGKGRIESWAWVDLHDEDLDVLIDGANIMIGRSSRRAAPSPTPPDWGRLHDALAELTGGLGHLSAHVVLDTSFLAHPLARHVVEDLDRLRESGGLTVAEDADPVLLDEAFQRDLLVVSNDRFLDWRRLFPFLQGNKRNFYRPVWAPDGTVVGIERHRLTDEHDQGRLSEHEEQVLLKKSYLGRHLNDVAASYFRCGNESCSEAERPEGTAVPHRERDGRLICRACREPLLRIQRRVPTVGLVLSGVECGESRRLVVEYGEQLMIGRNAMLGDVRVSDIADRGGRSMSRTHALVRVSEAGVEIKDLNSTNGTRQTRVRGGESSLEAGVWFRMDNSSTFVLGNVLEVRRSGRRHPFDADVVIHDGNARNLGGGSPTVRERNG